MVPLDDDKSGRSRMGSGELHGGNGSDDKRHLDSLSSWI